MQFNIGSFQTPCLFGVETKGSWITQSDSEELQTRGFFGLKNNAIAAELLLILSSNNSRSPCWLE